MTPKEALELVDNVCAQVAVNRQVQGKIIEAMQVLGRLVQEQEVQSTAVPETKDSEK